ncbi:MAG: hypothetical protein IJV31_01495 [Clostridia bacterium]|nr:hypothetical protein [Clostridia bacterium]
MITYLDNSNAKQYHILFDKATTLLKSKKPDSLTEALRSISTNQDATPDELWSDFTISSLNEYFAYLEDILKAAHQDSNEDAERFYVRLPLDEEVFAINADTREITIPRSFENAGVGVQGDELAEVVYFTIDRFFDSVDLASDNIHIAIQWELNRNGEQVKGFSRNFGKDIESIPGTIIFGWPISHELTETSGSIRFAVRFYSIDTDNQSFNYSLTTLPATVRINSSIDHEIIEKSQEEINHGSIITSRIKNAGIYNPSMPTPSAPIITSALHVINPETTAKIVDLPVDNSGSEPVYGSVKIGIGAQPSDVGVVGYNWKKFPYLETTGEYDSNSGPITDNVKIEYVKVTSNLNPDYQYYTKNGDIYSLLDVVNQLKPYGETNTYPFLYAHVVGEGDEETTENTPEVSNSPIGYERASTVGGGFLTDVYVKISTVEVDTTGIYTADISARALVNTVTTTMLRDDGIVIPGPLSPVITMPADKTTEEDQVAHIIVGSSNIELTPDVVAGEVGKDASEVGESPSVEVSKAWQVFQNGEWVAVENIDGVVNVSTDANPVLTISNVNNTATIGDQYRILATSVRNKVSTSTTSGTYRVTHAPVKPEVLVRDYNAGSRSFEWTPRAYDSSNNIKNVSLSRNDNLEVAVTAADMITDGISYIWVQANRHDSEILYNVDLPDDEQYLAFINKINTALGITDVSEPFISDTEQLRTKDDIIKELKKISAATTDANDGVSRYEDTYTPEERGVYYCVVINELNNNLAVNVSPFFIVS